MGPQPDLALHQRFRRLVANGVKCISNYSELSTYHEYGNIFVDIMYSFRVTRAWSQNSETITGNQVAAREKCRLIDAQKTPTIDILKCYWGYTLVDWNPWLHFWGIKCFLFLFRMCHAIFREYFQRSRFCLSSAMFVNADLLSPPGPFFYFITIAFPD